MALLHAQQIHLSFISIPKQNMTGRKNSLKKVKCDEQKKTVNAVAVIATPPELVQVAPSRECSVDQVSSPEPLFTHLSSLPPLGSRLLMSH